MILLKSFYTLTPSTVIYCGKCCSNEIDGFSLGVKKGKVELANIEEINIFLEETGWSVIDNNGMIDYICPCCK